MGTEETGGSSSGKREIHGGNACIEGKTKVLTSENGQGNSVSSTLQLWVKNGKLKKGGVARRKLPSGKKKKKTTIRKAMAGRFHCDRRGCERRQDKKRKTHKGGRGGC